MSVSFSNFSSDLIASPLKQWIKLITGPPKKRSLPLPHSMPALSTLCVVTLYSG